MSQADDAQKNTLLELEQALSQPKVRDDAEGEYTVTGPVERLSSPWI